LRDLRDGKAFDLEVLSKKGPGVRLFPRIIDAATSSPNTYPQAIRDLPIRESQATHEAGSLHFLIV